MLLWLRIYVQAWKHDRSAVKTICPEKMLSEQNSSPDCKYFQHLGFEAIIGIAGVCAQMSKNYIVF
jgi:hypothetical protein